MAARKKRPKKGEADGAKKIPEGLEFIARSIGANIPKEKPTPQATAPREQDLDPSELDKDAALKFVTKTIANATNLKNAMDKERLSNYNNLNTVLSEWLDCFIIIGYDVDGSATVLTNTKTPKDMHSLSHLLKSVFMDLVVKPELRG